MAFANFRLFEITGTTTSGAPVLSTTPLPFLAVSSTESEINNVSITLQPELTTKTYTADNLEEKDSVVKGYNGTVTVYGVDVDALNLIGPYTKDANGNLALTVNSSSENQIAIFYRAKNEKGKNYNMWLYDVEFEPTSFDVAQDEDNPTTIALNFFAKLKTVNGKKMPGTIVYEGNTGYIEEGTEPTGSDIYVPTFSTTSA